MSHSASKTSAVHRQQQNLPIELNSFIGRQREVAELLRLLTSSRLLTLTGAAGCGKTRLALRAAANVSEQYRDGVYWVELAPLADPYLVPQAVAKAVNAANPPGRSTVDALLHALRDKELLLALDNCEHLLSACGQLVETLWTLPGLSFLLTSREPLGIPGERRYPLSPLALPPAGAAVDDIGQYDAVRLFVERARAIVPTFELTAENADVVAHICQKLDGIPLALELASVRINVLSAEQIATRLDDRFELLAATSRVTLSPHETLHAALDWSHDLLSVSQQIMFRRMAVFAGGCALATAETICAGDGIERGQVLSLLGALVEKSLVVAHTLRRREARYTLLEIIRQHAREKLTTSGERSRLRHRHLRHFLQLAEETRPKLSGQYQRLWLDWLEDEYGNLRAALSWSLESGDIESGLRIAIAIYEFWTIRDYAEEALAWIEQLLARADEKLSPLVRANALAYATFLAGFCGNSTAQAAYGRKAADLAKSLGAEGQRALAWATAGEAYSHGRPGPLPSGGSARAWALGAEAYSARAKGDYESELAIYKQVIQLHREAGARTFLGFSLITASFAAWSLDEHAQARAMVDEGLPLLREAGNPYQIAMTLNGSGDLARCEGN